MRDFHATSARPVFVDLFCGAGLLSAGFKAAGFDPILALDLDEAAVSSYNKNIRPCAEVDSINNVRSGIYADVLIAGPPCQGFSTLGRRDPKDKRNDLCLLIPEWASQLKAKICVVENVPMFTKSSQYGDMVATFRKQGFAIYTYTLQAHEFGTPQKRTRSFTIASMIGEVGRPQATHKKPVASRTVFDMPVGINDPLDIAPVPSVLAMERFVQIPDMGGKKELMSTHPHLCPASWFKIPGQATDVWGRINPNEPSNTVRCNFQNPSKGRYIHPSENRTLTLREGARLQGIPDAWKLSGSRQQISRQIGNGVPVQMSKAVAQEVMKTVLAQLEQYLHLDPHFVPTHR